MPSHNRPERIGHQIQREVCDLLLRKVKDPRVRSATITRVKVSLDLQHAAIYFCTPRQEGLKDKTQKGLDSAKGFIRNELGKRLFIRKVPQIDFIADEQYERALDVAETIARLESEEEEQERR